VSNINVGICEVVGLEERKSGEFVGRIGLGVVILGGLVVLGGAGAEVNF